MRRLPPLEIVLTAGATLATFAVWSATDGGYAEVVWYPTGLLLLVLLVVLEWAVPHRPLGRGTSIGVAAFAAFTGWSYLSIIWAQDRGLALTGANRTLVYLLVFVLIARQTWRGADAALYAVAWALVTVTIGVVDLAIAAGAGHIGSGFSDGRLAVPIEYANANAALFMLAAWPLVALAQSPTAARTLRALALGGAGVAVELALLAQSKGAALASAATVVVLLLIVPHRVRVAVPIMLVALVVALFRAPLLNVYVRLHDADHPAAALRAATATVAVSFACLLALGALIAWIDERLLRSAPRRGSALARVAALAAAVVVVVAGVAGVVRFGNPVSIAARTWHAFKYPARESSSSSHFVTSAGNHRYDFWRVAAHQVAASPVLGAGIDNFGADYVRQRHSSEEPLYPHSLEARLLGGTGIVGFVLFGIFAGVAGLLCARAARSRSEFSLVGVVGVAMLAYWLAHGSVDWLWEFPGLTGPVLAASACGSAVGRATAKEARTRSPSIARRVAIVAAVTAAAVALTPAWLAARETSLAIGIWRTQPATAYARLAQAARLNPLTDQSYVVAGTVAERRRDWPRARRFFSLALERNDDNWYSLLEEGVAEARGGEPTTAVAALRRALRLDPREPLIRDVLSAVLTHRRLSAVALDRALIDRAHISAQR